VTPDALLFFVCMFPKLDQAHDREGLDILPTGPPRPLRLDFPLPMAFKDVREETPKSLKDLLVACRETVKAAKVARVCLSEFHPSRRVASFVLLILTCL
jgi:hypothetical protein